MRSSTNLLVFRPGDVVRLTEDYARVRGLLLGRVVQLTKEQATDFLYEHIVLVYRPPEDPADEI